jgi:beta-lactamase superfamily II metal-dependent hydrolase
MALRISLLKASQGDCFLFQEDESNKAFLIDCGFKLTFKQEILKNVEIVDFAILTHIDSDHIMGCIPLLEAVPDKFNIGTVYVNSPSLINLRARDGLISIKQALTLEKLLQSKKIGCDPLVEGDQIIVSDALEIHVLSPVESDLKYLASKYDTLLDNMVERKISTNHTFTSIESICSSPDQYHSVKTDILNATSIVCLIHYKKHKLLFTGDGHPSVISTSLRQLGFSETNKLSLSFLKISHHGSYHNLSEEFLSLIKCSNFIVSTNGGAGRSMHPSRATLIKFILKCERNTSEVMTFYFNYPVNKVSAKSGVLLTEKEKIAHKVEFKTTASIELR